MPGEHGKLDLVAEIAIARVTLVPKPCPFCGGSAKLIFRGSGSSHSDSKHITNRYSVECEECGIQTATYESDILQGWDGTVRIEKNGAIEAIETWNRRVQNEQQVENPA